MSEMNWEENKVANEILRYVIDKSSNDVTSLKIPYQFFIPLLTALYDQLIGKNEEDIRSNCFEESILKTSIGSLKNSSTENAPLCAITYLSWEREHRLFVARRVCPPTLHFLGHSYIPDGWGIVGQLTKSLQKEYDFQKPNNWMEEFCISNINSSPTQDILPFKRDIDTLKYKSVSALPIFKQLTGSNLLLTDKLLGVLIFFFNEKLPVLPDTAWQNKLSNNVSIALEEHLKIITEGKSIAQAWKDLAKNDNIKIASLTLSNGNPERRNKMQASILELMSRPDFYAVIDSGNGTNSNVILIAPRDVDQKGQFNREHVESVILNAVSQARLKLEIKVFTEEVISELLWLT